MATIAGPNPIDSGSNEREAEELRFHRLERVRARQRASRQRRLILISTLALALAGAVVLGFAAIRRASSGHVDAAGAPPPVMSVTPVAPAPAPEKTSAPPTSAPMPARSEGASADVAAPRRGQLDVLTPVAPPPTNRATGSSAPARGDQRSGDQRSSEVGDPTAVIDWLLKTSRAKGQ